MLYSRKYNISFLVFFFTLNSTDKWIFTQQPGCSNERRLKLVAPNSIDFVRRFGNRIYRSFKNGLQKLCYHNKPFEYCYIFTLYVMYIYKYVYSTRTWVALYVCLCCTVRSLVLLCSGLIPSFPLCLCTHTFTINGSTYLRRIKKKPSNPLRKIDSRFHAK